MKTGWWHKWLGWVLVGSALALVCVRVLLVQGTIFPAVVASGSMAPTLLGPHRTYRCPTCGDTFSSGCETVSEPNVVCPNCGDKTIPADQTTPSKGTRVLLDRWKSIWQTPQRGAVVAIRRDPPDSDLEIKRVVGLPGETITIRQGDIFVNGARWKKSWSEFQPLAIPVHNDQYRPTTQPTRWSGSQGSRWLPTATGYRHQTPPADQQSDNSLDWLTYHHRACIPNLVPAKPADAEAFVVDYCAYNQALSRSHLAPVHDLMLSFRVHLQGTGRLLIATSTDRNGPRLELNSSSGQATIFQHDIKLGSTPLPPLATQRYELAYGFIDGQILLVLHGQELLRLPLTTASPFLRATQPFAIASTSDQTEVTQIAITRDIHYLHPHDSRANWKSEPLGTTEYLLLGDNPPLSADSRSWPVGGVPRQNLYGHVIFRSRQTLSVDP